MKSFGSNLKRARKRANLTQGDLATKSGVAIATIKNYERGVGDNPQRKTVSAVAEACGVPTSFFEASFDIEADHLIERFLVSEQAIVLQPIEKAEELWLRSRDFADFFGGASPSHLQIALVLRAYRIGMMNFLSAVSVSAAAACKFDSKRGRSA